jgi:glutathione-regulated potassium-efflux system ancillary protein KefF
VDETLPVILVLYAHPYPARSRACAALLEGVRRRDDVEIRSLYELYPDFDIDGDAERLALTRAQLVVWLHPLYWYSAPALMKHWFDHVLIKGWAHGDGAHELDGKDCLWVTTTGGGPDAFTPEGRHRHPFDAFEPPMRQTARYCGMNWLPPMAVRGSHEVSLEELHAAAAELAARLDAWARAAKARSHA